MLGLCFLFALRSSCRSFMASRRCSFSRHGNSINFIRAACFFAVIAVHTTSRFIVGKFKFPFERKPLFGELVPRYYLFELTAVECGAFQKL